MNHFQGSLFSKLQALPTDAKPVMSSSWHYQDEAFYNVTEGIHKVVEKLTSRPSIAPLFTQAPKEESTAEFILRTGAEPPTKLPIPQSVSPSKLDSPMEQEMVHAPDTTYPPDLTSGEVEVLRLLAQGLTSAQIAEQLSIGLPNVNSQVRSIYNKLRVSSRSAATRYAIEHNLL